LETPLEENINRVIAEEGNVEARTIEDAIAVLRYQLCGAPVVILLTSDVGSSLLLILSPCHSALGLRTWTVTQSGG